MSNSSLVTYTKISPFKTSPRNHKIDTISIHCMAGQLSVETCGNIFQDPKKEASSNYGIGSDGRIAMYVEEKDRSFCTSNRDNDMRAVTIEVASDSKDPYRVNDVAYDSLIRLLVDICQRNDIKKLLWKGDKSLIGQVDKQNMTVHRWFATKACPGDYLYNKHAEIAKTVNTLLKEAAVPQYEVGKRYTLQAERKVFTGPGTEYPKKKFDELNKSAKRKDIDGDGALDAGSTIVCKEVKKGKDDIWIRFPSGWIRAYNKGKVFLK